MSILLSVQRSEIFSEFTPDEQEFWFAIKEKAVAHHVDTLYYTILIKDDSVTAEHPGVRKLLDYLEVLKGEKNHDPDVSIDFFDLEVSRFGTGQLYVYGLQMPEKYDIFVAKALPNADTPRIQVQLRTHALVVDGLYPAIEESIRKVEEILRAFGCRIKEILDNRFDYAFHTNCIQKPIELIGTESLNKHLVTCFNRFNISGKVAHRIDETLDLDYFTLGSRKGKYLFFRAYEKTKEVVEQNYKAFFFKKWFERGLISRYDLYVLEKAYELGSYNTGMLIGRLDWYIEHGKDPVRVEQMKELRRKYTETSSNNTALKKAIKGILPPNTVIFNIEFETKRKFYNYYNKFLKSFKLEDFNEYSMRAERLYKILALRRPFIDKLLTEYVSFVDDRTNIEVTEMDWWRRIRSCKITDVEDAGSAGMLREYSRNVDIRRQRTKMAGTVANIAMLKRRAADGDDCFGEDFWDAFTFLNDNDVISPEAEKAIRSAQMSDYPGIRRRKARQMRPILKKLKESEEAEMPSAEKLAKKMAEEEFDAYGIKKLLPEKPVGPEKTPEFVDLEEPLEVWRCIRCDITFSGKRFRAVEVEPSGVFPFNRGICRRCVANGEKIKNEQIEMILY